MISIYLHQATRTSFYFQSIRLNGKLHKNRDQNYCFALIWFQINESHSINRFTYIQIVDDGQVSPQLGLLTLAMPFSRKFEHNFHWNYWLNYGEWGPIRSHTKFPFTISILWGFSMGAQNKISIRLKIDVCVRIFLSLLNMYPNR